MPGSAWVTPCHSHILINFEGEEHSFCYYFITFPESILVFRGRSLSHKPYPFSAACQAHLCSPPDIWPLFNKHLLREQCWLVTSAPCFARGQSVLFKNTRSYGGLSCAHPLWEAFSFFFHPHSSCPSFVFTFSTYYFTDVT